MRRRKIDVTVQKVVGKDGYQFFHACAVYRAGTVKRQRTFRHHEAAIATAMARDRLLGVLELQGIDPECVAAERFLSRHPDTDGRTG